MTKKPETKVRSAKKKTRTTKADELVKGSDVELDEEELKRISGGYIGETEKNLK
jgi:hypothetical protein